MKNEGTKIQRQYGPWMHAEGLSFASSKSDFLEMSTSRDNGLRSQLRNTMGKTMEIMEDGKALNEGRNKSTKTLEGEVEERPKNSGSELLRR